SAYRWCSAKRRSGPLPHCCCAGRTGSIRNGRSKGCTTDERRHVTRQPGADPGRRVPGPGRDVVAGDPAAETFPGKRLSMGWNNPPVPWRELERTLSGRDVPPESGDGNDSPAWGRKREKYAKPPNLSPPGRDDTGARGRVPYAELHCHSNFSFLDGTSHPEELIEEAARLELDAIAITDHDGMYGAARFAEAADEVGMRTVFGAELSLGLSEPPNGVADPDGEHLLLLAKGQDGYTSRSEERRVGKEGRARGGAEPWKREDERGGRAVEVR